MWFKVNRSSIKARIVIQRLTKFRLETGFSMLEAVVVVGVLLALAVGGFFAYGPIAENAKIAKVKSTASEVHTAVLVANIDGDPATKPQDVIENWNNSTDAIRVEILEPVANVATMTTAESAPGVEEDFCVQATNVASPNINARVGACSDVISGSGSDADGDGIPDATDPDIDGNGVPNTAWESYSIVKDKQATGNTVSYANADGSKTTWNYKDTATYNHEHNPIEPYVLDSGFLDIIRIEKASPSQINVTAGTNGNMSNSTGAVGGSFGAYMHGDITCKNPSTGVITPRYSHTGVVLKGLYLAVSPVPGPNTGILSFSCQSNEIVVDFTLYPERYVDWSDNYYGGYSYFFTRDQIIKWVPAPAA